MSYFKSLVARSDIRPLSQSGEAAKSGASRNFMLKDQFSITSWLAVGACMNAILFLLLGRLTLLLPFALLAVRFGDTLLQVWGIKRNPYMDGVIFEKHSAQLPNEDGTHGPEAAKQQIVVFLIGAKCNHPLGILAPGFNELGAHFQGMQRDVEASASKYGFLGSSGWTANERSTSNELLTVMYFKTSEGLHAYAHDAMHREAWNWWNKTVHKFPHLSIWHELYVAPKGHWESIYDNSRPTLLAATTYPIGDKFVSPVVSAAKGILKSSRGRMTLTDGKDNDAFVVDTYEDMGRTTMGKNWQ